MIAEVLLGIGDSFLLLEGRMRNDIGIVRLDIVDYRIGSSGTKQTGPIGLVAWEELCSHLCGVSCSDIRGVVGVDGVVDGVSVVGSHRSNEDREGP